MPRLRLANVPFVTLNVGKPSTTFNVHRNLLCEASPVFEAMFQENRAFQEARSQTATLEDDEPEAFENICQWLYNKACELPPTNIGEGYSPFLWSVAKSYAAAEKYGMVALKNYLIDRFFVFGASLKSLRSPAPTIVQYVYRQTPTKSPLRRLFVAFYVWKSNPGWYEHDYTRRLMRTIPDFAIDLACTMGTVIHDFPANNPFEGSSHIYHEVMSPTEHGQDNDQSIL